MADLVTVTNVKTDLSVCLDIIGFQDYLKRLRLVDDSIILSLNSTVTTCSNPKDEESNISNCKRLHEQLKQAYESRDQIIHACLNLAEGKVSQFKEANEGAAGDANSIKEFKRNQTRLRMMQKELTVEQIIQDRSMKALQERCRRYVSF